MIAALPDASALEAMDAEERDAVYEAAQNAADALEALTDEQQEQLSDLDTLAALMEWFNAQTETTDTSETTDTPTVTEINSLQDLTNAISGNLAQQKNNLMLKADIDLSGNLTINRDITIDLNDHNINLKDYHIVISGSGTLTLTDNSNKKIKTGQLTRVAGSGP